MLFSTRVEDRTFAEKVAAHAQLTLMTAPTPQDAVRILSQQQVGAMLVDASTQGQYDVFENAVQEAFGLFSDKLNSNTLHYLGSGDIHEVPYLIQSPLFGHYLIRNFSDIDATAEHYGRVVSATLGERAFGIKNFLRPEAKIQTVSLKKTTQKQGAVEAVKNYLLANKFQARISSVIANAVDELLMNAMFDAPVDAGGKHIESGSSRATEIALEGQRAVEMHVGFDGNCFAVSVVDHFGSLDRSKLLGSVSKIYKKDSYRVRTSVAGAGIGLASVFHSGGSFFFASESGARTEATVLFRKAENFRSFKSQFRHLSTQFYF